MENTVMMEQQNMEAQATEAATQAGDAQEGGYSAAELLGIDEAYTVEHAQPEQPAEPEQAAQEDDAPRQGDPQDKVSAAFAEQRRKIEARYRREYEEKLANDPMRSFGQRMVEQVARQHGVTLEQAAAIAEESMYKSIAEQEGVSPAVARAIFGGPMARPQQPVQQDNSPEAFAARVRRDLETAELPEGFDFDASVQDIGFVELLTKYPVEAAARIYHSEKRAQQAPKDMAERIKARQAIPQPMSPQQPVTPQVDFNTIPDEEYIALRREMRERRHR